MRCPTCKKTVADEAAVCPHCDTVLDPTLADPPPPPRRRPAQGKARPPAPARPGTSGGTGRRAGASPRQAPRKAPSQRMPEAPPPSRAAAAPRRDWRDEVSAEDWAEMPQGKRAEFVPDKAMDPDDVMGAAGRFLRQLTSADRIAFVGAAVMFLACFFPWKETVQDGEVLGLLSSGVVVFVLSFGAMAAIVARVQQSLSRTNPLILWAAQLGGLGLAELWSLIYVRLAWDSTEVMAPIGNYTMWVSKPTLGVVMALAGGVVAILGTVAGLRTPPA